mmetsp:Transcript_65784/g.156950  ORF Transcript_65784/g.156950 Transcript_65784/m.156950 type:complete len:222 (-) Transcript_65784:1467-2132(-)
MNTGTHAAVDGWARSRGQDTTAPRAVAGRRPLQTSRGNGSNGSNGSNDAMIVSVARLHDRILAISSSSARDSRPLSLRCFLNASVACFRSCWVMFSISNPRVFTVSIFASTCDFQKASLSRNSFLSALMLSAAFPWVASRSLMSCLVLSRTRSCMFHTLARRSLSALTSSSLCFLASSRSLICFRVASRRRVWAMVFLGDLVPDFLLSVGVGCTGMRPPGV